MAKKQSLPTKHSASGYTNWDTRRTIREAENVARWNPWLAHAWMNEARNQLSLDRPFFNEYDNAVTRINTRWILLKQFRWFNEADFWTFDGECLPPTLLSYTTDSD
jgi:hypothetical protein